MEAAEYELGPTLRAWSEKGMEYEATVEISPDGSATVTFVQKPEVDIDDMFDRVEAGDAAIVRGE